MAMMAKLIGGFIAILIGVSLIGTVSSEVNSATISGNALAYTSSWGSTVLSLTPGFFALAIMGIGVAVTYSALRDTGIV